MRLKCIKVVYFNKKHSYVSVRATIIQFLKDLMNNIFPVCIWPRTALQIASVANEYVKYRKNPNNSTTLLIQPPNLFREHNF